jgi:hypothetical protein
MWLQLALLAGQMILGEVTKPRPKRIGFEEFKQNNGPSEIRPVAYGGGTFEVTPSRIWYGDFTQRAVERDSHWTDYIFLGGLAFLLDAITVAYRYYAGEAFSLCYGPDVHVERVTIGERLMFQAVQGTDNAGGGFLIDDPQAWGGDQPPGEGGIYTWVDLTRGNYTDPTNAYLESILTTAPNRTPALHGIATAVSRGRLTASSPAGFTESGYFAAGGVGFIPHFREWKFVLRRQPDHLATGFNKVRGPGETARRHMNPAETIYEWSTSQEFGARAPESELNLDSLRVAAETMYNEDCGWSGKIEQQTTPGAVIKNVLSQIDGVLDPSPSLGLTLRLIRRDYTFGSLRVLNQSSITSVSNFTPGTYEDTVNKIIVPFFDPDNNFKPRPGIYIDPANISIQDGRVVPLTQDYLGVGDYPTANALATRDGRALSIPRASMTCNVLPSFGRLSYQGEAIKLEWSLPTFSKVMRVQSVTPGTREDSDYVLVLIEDQFASGLRTSGNPGTTGHVDPAVGLDTAPPSATWNDVDFPPDGLRFDLTLTNTNQFQPTITGGIIFGTYAPGGQYARIYVTEPGGVQTLSPIRLSPDDNNEATFPWPALGVGEYEFCVQTYSLHDATNGVKVCATIDIAAIGSPSISPSSSVSPSVSPSSSESPSPSASVSPSISPSSSASASVSSSTSASQSPSTSVSPSPSISPSSSASASQSPSSSVSPSAPPDSPDDIPDLLIWFKADEDVFIDTGSTLATNGQTVQQWNDQSGNAIHASQGTSGDRPTYRTNQINSLPAVDFATSKWMSFTEQTVTDFTLFAVVKQGSGATVKTIVGGTNATSKLTLRFDDSVGGGGYNLTNLVGGGINSSEEEPLDFIQTCVRSGVSGTTMRIDEVDTGTPGSASSSLGVSHLGTSVVSGTPTNFLNGLIAEFIIYSGAISDANRTIVEGYLRTKYDLANPAEALTDPTTITGCVLWLKADSLALSDGTAVATWADSSGNGNDATQATSGSRPTFQTNEINSTLPVIRLDGSDDWMQVPSISIGALAVVHKYRTSGNYPDNKSPFNDRTASEGRLFLTTSGAATLYSPAFGGTNRMLNRHFRNGTKTNSLAPIDSFQISCGSWPGSVLTDAYDVGRDDQNNARCWDGDIAEVIAYDRGLSPANRVRIENYLNTKYVIF